MKSSRSDEDIDMEQIVREDGDVEMKHIIQEDDYEEEYKTDSVSFEDAGNNTLDDHLSSNAYTDDDETDPVTNIVQPSAPNIKEISIALALFRHRHRLSKSCIDDLCDLLRTLGVSNVPADFRAIQRNVTEGHENVLNGKKYLICSICGHKGTTATKCENVNCQSFTGFKETPTTLCTFKLLPQITSILERHELLSEPDDDNTRINDVQSAEIRRNVAIEERKIDPGKKIITFLMNSDGVVLKKFSRSMWITSMVINELPRAIRFNANNIIICSISVGPNKPKKKNFQNMIVDWVYELKQLQVGFYISYPYSKGNFVKTHAYLIAAALDKPAQALLLYINEPVGFYSCPRCTIKGKLI
jgi:hypothetical protein